MKEKRLLRRILANGCLCLVLAITVSLATPASSADTITLTFNWETTAGRNSYAVWPYRPGGPFEKSVTKYTNGRVKLDIKERIYGATESLLAIADGRVDMGTQIIPFVGGTYPLLDFGSLPGLLGGGHLAGYEWGEAFIDPRMMKIWNSYSKPRGFIILGSSSSNVGEYIWGNKAFRTLDDFKGAKIRAGSMYGTLALRELGAKSITLPVGEVEQALARGAIDANNTTLSHGCEHAFFNICKYISKWPMGSYYPEMVAINAKAFDALPEELQEGLLKAGEELTFRLPLVAEEVDTICRVWIRTTKCQMVIPDKAEVEKAAKSFGPIAKTWLDKVGPHGADVLSIALETATGQSRESILNVIKGYK